MNLRGDAIGLARRETSGTNGPIERAASRAERQGRRASLVKARVTLTHMREDSGLFHANKNPVALPRRTAMAGSRWSARITRARRHTATTRPRRAGSYFYPLQREEPTVSIFARKQ